MLALALSAALAAPCPTAPARVVDAPELDPEEVAHALAPVLYVEGAKNPLRRHWDLPMRVDFDGDLVSRNNADALRSGAYRERIVPTLYWSVLETETHVFATYHAFHGLDWTWYPPVLNYEWHENDGENLQVVARKTGPTVDDLVVELLATQAHVSTRFTAVGDAAFDDDVVSVHDGAWTVGDRVAVYMAKGSHALYPAHDKAGRFDEIRRLRRGIRLDPVRDASPPGTWDRRGGYELVSTAETFWRPDLVGHGRLMDQTFDYCGPIVGDLTLPRHYDSAMLAGPGKRDSGIAPFAVDIGLSKRAARLGALFFDPARRYAEVLGVPDDWSDTYLNHPYAPASPGVADAPFR